MIKGGNRQRKEERFSLLSVEIHICLPSSFECQEVRVRARNQVGVLH